MPSPLRNALIGVAVFIAMCAICLPGLWVMLNAFRPNVVILGNENPLHFADYTLDNFRLIFGYGEMQGLPVLAYFRNSLVIALTSTVLALAFGMAGGYAFARFHFPGKSSWFVALMLTRAIPGIALSLPIFIVWSHLGLIDTQIGLILVYLALNVPFTVWLIDGFFRQLPIELCEAAQIDGCTRWQAFWKVEFPLARGGIAAAGIFAFLTSWNEFALASQLTRSPATKTMPVALIDFTAQFTIDWAGMCAMAVLIIVPALVLTFIA